MLDQLRQLRGVAVTAAVALPLCFAAASAQQNQTQPAPSGALAVPASPAPAADQPSGAGAADAATPPLEDGVAGSAAWAKLVGNTITGTSSAGSFLQFFDANGTVRYADKDGKSNGTWVLQGDRVCFDYPDDDDRSCETFEVSGTNGQSTGDDGVPVRFEILPGNPKGL